MTLSRSGLAFEEARENRACQEGAMASLTSHLDWYVATDPRLHLDWLRSAKNQGATDVEVSDPPRTKTSQETSVDAVMTKEVAAW
ncbi:uncharacterized protein LOC124699304 isoform X2 [Lolium rigidum]|uniref:uncharacterized protein LOC124699304 isoform X2 n=1 Tax=Lolium rigidum TaxID=89674 RepID=UPI001F5DF31A|nr:uncharacterized protein LOC124699304 isoform X2 [Lolium rigidum]